MQLQEVTHGGRADAITHLPMAERRRGGSPAAQVELGTPAVFDLIHVDITIAPATQQAHLQGHVFAIEVAVHREALFFVVDLLGRKHETVEGVVLIAQPGIARRVDDVERRDVRGLVKHDGDVLITVVAEARLDFIVHALTRLGVAEAVVHARIAEAVAATGAERQRIFFLGTEAHAATEITRIHFIETVLSFAGDGAFTIERDDAALTGLGVGEIAVQRADEIAAAVVWAPVQIEVGTNALAVDGVLAQLDLTGHQVAAERIVGIIRIAHVVVLHFDVVRFEVTVLVVDAECNAEGIVEHLAEVEGRLGAGFATQRLVAGFDLGTDAAAITVERGSRFHLDLSTNGIARHIRRRRLDHGQALGGIRGDHVQWRGAAAVFRRTDVDAVHADAVQRGIQAADHHVAAFTLVAGHADARQALQRLGHVLVRVLAHGIG